MRCRPIDSLPAGASLAAGAEVYGSAPYDMSGGNAFGGIASIYDQLRLFHDACIIVLGMVGDDHNAVEFGSSFQRRAGHIELVSTPAADEGEKRVVVFDMRTALLQQFDNGECGRLAKVVYVAFVGHPQDQDA